jgi:hypothetical protein
MDLKNYAELTFIRASRQKGILSRTTCSGRSHSSAVRSHRMSRPKKHLSMGLWEEKGG